MLDADLKFAPTPIHTFALPETVSLRQFGPLESIDPNDAMILPHGTNPDRMKFSERTAERFSAILVFGRVRYWGCDCGRDHTDLM